MNDWNMYDPFRADQQMPQQTQQMPQMMPGDCGCGMPMGPMWPMGQMMPQQMQPMPMPQMMPDGCGAPMWPPMPMPYGPQR